MKNIQSIFKNNFFAAFSFKQYSIFSLWFRIIVIIVMIPFHAMTLFLGAWYQVGIFFFKLIQVPPKYIKQTIDENQVSSAPLFVVYLIAYPAKFWFDFLIALDMIFLAILHFFFVLSAFISSIGGIKFQPYLFEADGDVKKEAPTYRLPSIIEIALTVVIFLVILLGVLIPRITEAIEAGNERIEFIEPSVSYFLNYSGFDDDYSIIEAYYFSDDSRSDFAIVRIKHQNADYFIEVTGAYYLLNELTVLEYNDLKSTSSYDSRYSISANKIEQAVNGE